MEVLIDLYRDPTMRRRLDEARVVRFTPVGPESYEDIRAMVGACEAAGFTELR